MPEIMMLRTCELLGRMLCEPFKRFPDFHVITLSPKSLPLVLS